MPDAVYKNMRVVENWMKLNRRAVVDVKQLPLDESASVPATFNGNIRYLFAIPEFKSGGMYEEDRLPPKDTILTLKVAAKPHSVKVLGTGQMLTYDYSNGTVRINLPKHIRTSLVDVLQVEL